MLLSSERDINRLLENRCIRIGDVRQCKEYDLTGPIRYDAMTGYDSQSMLVVPMRNREGEILGVLQLINAMDEAGNVQEFSEDMVLVLESVASQAAITIQNVRYIREIKELFRSFVRVMSSAMLSIRKGTLSQKEREIMEEHVVVTDKLLSRIRFSADLAHVRQWASSHHELLDGSGYPNHLMGNDIPYEVRIITILDIFDALVADDRPYKPGMPVPKALSILEVMAEKEGKLDPKLTKLFIESRCWEEPAG